MQLKALKNLGFNSTLVQVIDKWLQNNTLGVVWRADGGIVGVGSGGDLLAESKGSFFFFFCRRYLVS